MRNSLRIAAMAVFAAAALITFASYHHGSSDIKSEKFKMNTSIDIMHRHRKLAVDNNTMQRAAEAVRASLNELRSIKCSSVAPYIAVANITYAKSDTSVHGIDRYIMELVFDGHADVFVLVERTAETFLLISSIPGPCDLDLSKQLAVSRRGWYC